MSDGCWHLLRYCSETSHWLFSLNFNVCQKVSRNWCGIQTWWMPTLCISDGWMLSALSCLVWCVLLIWHTRHTKCGKQTSTLKSISVSIRGSAIGPALYRWARKTWLFLRVHNFATVRCRKACDMSKVSRFCLELLLLLHPFNSLFSRTTWVIVYQKGKTSLD